MSITIDPVTTEDVMTKPALGQPALAELAVSKTALAEPVSAEPTPDENHYVDPALFHPNLIVRMWARALKACREHIDDEGGMSTIEYALGCVAAAALGALLYTVVTSGAVEDALRGIFERALNEGGK
ncbi:MULTISPECIES: DUF4244 domain-containing protein [Corynebacterium]|nr:DUF4244 domain-containing protein [Corynebacterium sp. zg254]